MNFTFVLLIISASLCMDKNSILGKFSVKKNNEKPVDITFVKDGESDNYSRSTDSSYFLKINSEFTKVFFDTIRPDDRHYAYYCGVPESQSPLKFTCTYDLNESDARYDASFVGTKYYLSNSAFKAFLSSFVLFFMIICIMLWFS